MFEPLFGSEMPLAMRFLIAFLVVLVLIGLTAWAVRHFGSVRFGAGSARGRQPRLAVVDAASVDSRRRLVIVRRDNVEHLLMIGGPSDVVVETNIVRASVGVPAPRAATVDTLPRAVPLGDSSWPLQPHPEPARPPRIEDHPLPAPADAVAPRPSPRAVDAILAAPHPEPVRPPLQPSRPASARPAPVGPGNDQKLSDMAQRLEEALRKSSEGGAEPAPAAPKSAGPGPKSSYENLEQEMASLLNRAPKQTKP